MLCANDKIIRDFATHLKFIFPKFQGSRKFKIVWQLQVTLFYF